MSLRVKTLAIIAVTLASLIICVYAASQIILLNSYVQLEEQNVRQNVERALNALNDEIAAIHATDREWAHWTDSYNFIEDRNDNYREGNTHDGIFYTYSLNVMLYVNTSGEIVFGRAFDLVEGQEVPIPENLTQHLGLDGILLDHTDDNGELVIDGISGILMLPEGPMLIASTPILTNEKEGPTRGSLIWGRYLTADEIGVLAEKTRLSLDAHRLDDAQLPADYQAADSPLLAGTPTFVNPLDSQTIAGYTLLDDIYGEPGLILRVDMPRDVYAQGQASIFYFIVTLVVVGLIFAGAILLMLERVVLSRLAYLNTNVSDIRSSTDFSTRISMPGKDELSNLATAINEMLEALAQSHIKLEHARDQALEALRLKGQILANVSHDARTPLNVITLRVEMLQRGIYGPTTEEQNKLLDTILVSSRQLLFFINNLLDMAQLESGKLHLEYVDFKPVELLNSIEMSMTPLAIRKGLKFKTEIGSDVPTILNSDPDRLNQILTNLVTNAIKFTDKGIVNVQMCRPDAAHWEIRVSDTGAGIPLEAQERIFEAFWQVDGSSTRKVTSGVGLGLSIVKQLTTLMGGDVTVQSAAGAGTTFSVVFPVERGEGEQHLNGQALRVNR